jgi:hypothetical protein
MRLAYLVIIFGLFLFAVFSIDREHKQKETGPFNVMLYSQGKLIGQWKTEKISYFEDRVRMKNKDGKIIREVSGDYIVERVNQ